MKSYNTTTTSNPARSILIFPKLIPYVPSTGVSRSQFSLPARQRSKPSRSGPGSSYNHLRNPLSAKRLAPHKGLPLDSCKRVEEGRDDEDHGARDKTRGPTDDANELHGAHDGVSRRAGIVGRDLADRGIEGG